MSVLIKGMEMPKSCDICPFSKTNDDLMSDDYRFRYCDFPYIGEFVTDYEKSRHPACPLILVPPHGRLIDADALPWENQGLMLTDPDEWGLKAWDIEHAPTIIPAEVE